MFILAVPYFEEKMSKHVSCEFDTFRVDTHASCVIHLIL